MPPAPGILPWQALLLACLGGAWAMFDPYAGCAAALLAWTCFRLGTRPAPRFVFFVLAAVAGFLYAGLRLPSPPPDDLPQPPRGRVSAVAAQVEEKPGNRLEILLERAVLRPNQDGDAQRLPGTVAWTWQDPPADWPGRLRPGARVDVSAPLRPAGGFRNPGTEGWAWRQRVRGVVWRVYTSGERGVRLDAPPGEQAAPDFRARLSRAVLEAASRRAAGPDSAAGPDNAAGMVLGLVTGERHAVAPQDMDMVRRASLAHLLAVSGMNLAAVAALGWGLAWLAGLAWPGLYLRIPRPRLAVLLNIPLVLAYLWLARFEPSLVRAAVMFGCWGLMILLGRSAVLLDGLFAALGLMFVLDPACVFDVGLALSAAAVAGIALLAPLAAPLWSRLRALGRWTWPLRLLGGWAVLTLAAQAAVSPIQASVFAEASPHLYLNLLWVPVVEWTAQPLAYLGALLLTWLPGAGEALLQASARVCALMLDSLRAQDARGWLEVYAVYRPLWPQVLGAGLLLGGAAYARAMTWPRRALWAGLCLVLLAAPPALEAWRQSRDQVRLTALDVGQGQALLLEAPGGRRWLIDGGGSLSSGFDLSRAVLAPALTWGRMPRLDGIILSHPDRDHSGGLAYLLRRFSVGFLACNGEIPRADDFDQALADCGLVPQVWKAGDAIDLAPELRVQVLAPPARTPLTGNGASLVLRVLWRGRPLAVLPGDAPVRVLAGLTVDDARDLGADVLVLPHHGSAGSLEPGFYDRVRPRAALVSTGAGNAFGFPSARVLAALESRGVPVYDTGRLGAVSALWVSPKDSPLVSRLRPEWP